MKQTPEQLALAHAYSTCLGHAEALREALVDLHQRDLQEIEWDKLAKEDRRLLDQFAYRYTRLQDDMGACLMPAILRALEEDIAAMSAVDRLNRLEQLGWLPSAAQWSELRRIRNTFAHDYPETPAERHAQGGWRWPPQSRYWPFWTDLPPVCTQSCRAEPHAPQHRRKLPHGGSFSASGSRAGAAPHGVCC